MNYIEYIEKADKQIKREKIKFEKWEHTIHSHNFLTIKKLLFFSSIFGFLTIIFLLKNNIIPFHSNSYIEEPSIFAFFVFFNSTYFVNFACLTSTLQNRLKIKEDVLFRILLSLIIAIFFSTFSFDNSVFDMFYSYIAFPATFVYLIYLYFKVSTEKKNIEIERQFQKSKQHFMKIKTDIFDYLVSQNFDFYHLELLKKRIRN